ncbi:endolytic transglycosylase MltG [Profundibacterium mesophilum]|uniref:Endolytic murein transglycosylase n=1 Tax=Profundibacterium mesophilum KAUST100406-0324 TaxID=1037889 RepID=A0A921P1D5_9RHOB|nr:endolytic transglycosylase MltG [Profundibacterium mesophilum]KAF0677408.1 putative exported protein [Profundibacterium mesophilum KAUST100406-0324]
MWRHIASNALSLLIVIVVMLGGLVVWGKRSFEQPGPLAQAICLRVEPGSNMRRVSGKLADMEAIESDRLFRIGAQYTERAGSLKAGSFLVPERASMDEIITIVTQGGGSTCGTEIVYRIGVNRQQIEVRELDPASGRFEDRADFDPVEGEYPESYAEVREQSDTRFRVALAEGATSWQIAQALEAAEFLSGEIADVPPEGMLAPDSYEVAAGADRQELVDRMIERQEARLAQAWANRADDLPIDTPEEALILASIVEKETGQPEERDQVASVFVNRLRKGMRLQTDPTVIYGVTEGKGVLGRGLRRSELDRVTPYNTYQIDGLPPGPIANPGLASLQAALNPASTPLLYFVADGTGGHAFAETLAEHNANVARWRAIEQQGASGQ